ncbi:G-type lectin S-receptor-like serine/threonine-protein kinase At4g27290 [Solanum verrucosum]|uniref:G-type lectin S-receptor-like serine/threonine-protein kinase At4g27290 n=1 Tax=Solanum verrucosum TaxID=315347 RepID=UPI0020D06A61|nr:G-type lectin S-receptor-like serine/threonine-protein kinase At4g27290 [Solanum verrucosum]
MEIGMISSSRKQMKNFLLILHILLCDFVCSISSAKDTITTTDFLIEGKTIVSCDGSFELGFFSPGSFANNWYVGIWYKHDDVPDKSVVWVANRETPLNNTSGVMLKIVDPGRLALVTSANMSIWSTNSSRILSVKNPIAQLLNSGNLIIRDANETKTENFLWQSFDYPTNTLLPGMQLGKNFVTGQEFYLSSWKNEYDPAPGKYTYHCDPTGYPQVVMRKGKVKVFSGGPWNGLRWSGVLGLTKNTIYTFKLDFDEKKAIYSYALVDNSVLSKLTLNSHGMLKRWTWDEKIKEWHVYLASPADACENYGACGAYGSCNIIFSPVCRCLDKFVPKDPKNWSVTKWSGGCIRRTPLNCQNGDGFLKYSDIKLPDTQYSRFYVRMTLRECEKVCLKNCSCMAYSNLDIRNGGSGCLLWYGDLIDIRELPGGQDIYIRIANSELGSKKKMKALVLSLSLLSGVSVIGLIIGLYILIKARKKKRKMILKDDLELPLFSLSTVTKATSNFSDKNMLGEGGFGSVYKGILEEGQEVAIKRLSKSSSQGVNEFKNEVNCIAKLQHRNLVKLIGCCVEGEEKILVYEYMPNRSLDFFIFDEEKSSILDWPKRFNIINGIARGLLYLHQDSRLRIIHRDLKASNILLDADMNPKISDFGIARSVIGNETGANTHHVVGTHGYMSPEYLIHGVFSIKSDVFSFGVLVLEIISGRRNRGFFHESHSINLLGHVWKLYKEGRPLELIDVHITDSCYFTELLRLIHVALLCVQHSPEDRPDMSEVVVMLANDTILPEAKEPGFYTESKFPDSEYSTSMYSKNEITITQLDPR